MSVVLGLKLLLVPTLIAAVTLAGRRWGPLVAGWLSAFPIVSAPVLFFIALQQGSAFTADAAVGTLSAVLAILAFGIGYAWAATRYSWPISLALALSGYCVSLVCLDFWAPSLPVAAPVVLAALILAPRLYPLSVLTAPAADVPIQDVYWRMATGALLVLLVTHFSASLGPRLSGMLAMFPVMGSVLAVFSHRHSGPAYTIRLLRGMVMGYYAFSIFCIVLSVALPGMAICRAFLLALACAVLAQAISRIYLLRATGSV